MSHFFVIVVKAGLDTGSVSFNSNRSQENSPLPMCSESIADLSKHYLSTIVGGHFFGLMDGLQKKDVSS